MGFHIHYRLGKKSTPSPLFHSQVLLAYPPVQRLTQATALRLKRASPPAARGSLRATVAAAQSGVPHPLFYKPRHMYIHIRHIYTQTVAPHSNTHTNVPPRGLRGSWGLRISWLARQIVRPILGDPLLKSQDGAPQETRETGLMQTHKVALINGAPGRHLPHAGVQRSRPRGSNIEGFYRKELREVDVGTHDRLVQTVTGRFLVGNYISRQYVGPVSLECRRAAYLLESVRVTPACPDGLRLSGDSPIPHLYGLGCLNSLPGCILGLLFPGLIPYLYGLGCLNSLPGCILGFYCPYPFPGLVDSLSPAPWEILTSFILSFISPLLL